MRNASRWGMWLATLAAMAVLQGCGVSDAKVHAEAGVAQFHKALDAGQFEAIWQDADERLRKSVSHEKFEAFIGAVHRKLGSVVETSNAGWQVNTHNFSTQVVLQQQTKFERGSGTETFTFSVDDKKVKLLGYNINSMELITI